MTTSVETPPRHEVWQRLPPAVQQRLLVLLSQWVVRQWRAAQPPTGEAHEYPQPQATS